MLSPASRLPANLESLATFEKREIVQSQRTGCACACAAAFALERANVVNLQRRVASDGTDRVEADLAWRIFDR